MFQQVDEFAYFPPGSKHKLSTSRAATLVVFERRYLLVLEVTLVPL